MLNKGKILEMCKRLSFPDGKMTDEFIYTIQAVDLFYYKNDICQSYIKEGYTDGANDGGIDFIYNDSETMYLVQGKTSKKLTYEDIKNLFVKMTDTVKDFNDKKTESYSSQLKTAYRNAYDDIDDNKNIELVLFTNTEINDSLRNKIQEMSKKEPFDEFKISVYDENDIMIKEAILEQDADFIPEDKIELFFDKGKKNNALQYGDNGIIVSVMASSLKKLYDDYKSKGLFSYNLREHIEKKKVDDDIDKTIKNEKENFWFYNNGVTIGCGDYKYDNTNVKLYGFSIINGAQTTTKIGQSKLVNENYDFPVVCKIVRSSDDGEWDEEFIGNISEYSNSQKPIKDRDLKANAKEQRLLQHGCENNGEHSLAVEIKRGVKSKKYRKVDKWQRVKNEEIGQLIWACILQNPGQARNGKNKMFSSDRYYKQIFKRKHDFDTIYDLVRLNDIYKEYQNAYVEKENDVEKIAITKNAKFTVLAIALYLYKKEKGLVDSFSSDGVKKDNVSGLLITDYDGDDIDEKLFNLFEFIIKQLYRLYEMKKESYKITSYSNFFKSESYYEMMLQEMDNLDEYDKDKISTYLEVFTKKKK